jgi:hypothetical protein
VFDTMRWIETLDVREIAAVHADARAHDAFRSARADLDLR